MKEEICDQGTLYALVVRGSNWEKGLNFFSASDDYLQVGTWKYMKGQKLSAHIHLNEPRLVQRTQEVVFVKAGKLRAFIYGEKRQLLKALELEQNDALILLEGGHGFEVLEDNTEVLEVKNGPYVGADKDRKRI